MGVLKAAILRRFVKRVMNPYTKSTSHLSLMLSSLVLEVTVLLECDEDIVGGVFVVMGAGGRKVAFRLELQDWAEDPERRMILGVYPSSTRLENPVQRQACMMHAESVAQTG